MLKISAALDVICREPYRLFFPLGIFAGTLGVGHWLFYAVGLSDSYSGVFHSTIQILVYLNCFIIGFLLTAIPRFAAAACATKIEIIIFLSILMVILFACMHSNWIVAESFFILWLLFLVRFVYVRIRNRPKKASSSAGKPPKELIWIPFGIINGIVGTMLHILGQTGALPRWALAVGKPMMDQGFLLCVVVGVGGFLIPRLMGTYERSSTQADASDDEACRAEKLIAKNVSGVGLYAAYATALFISFWIEGFGYAPLGHGLRAAVVTAAFVASRVLPRIPRVNDFYVRMAYTSVWMTAVGYWGAALIPEYQKEMLHITFIGGFSLMTFAVATMVILTHAGAMDVLRKPIWILWVVAIGLGLALVERFIVVIFPDQYFKLLGYSALLWMLAAGAWFLFVLPYFLKVPLSDEFDRMHQSAKDRIKSS